MHHAAKTYASSICNVNVYASKYSLRVTILPITPQIMFRDDPAKLLSEMRRATEASTPPWRSVMIFKLCLIGPLHLCFPSLSPKLPETYCKSSSRISMGLGFVVAASSPRIPDRRSASPPQSHWRRHSSQNNFGEWPSPSMHVGTYRTGRLTVYPIMLTQIPTLGLPYSLYCNTFNSGHAG